MDAAAALAAWWRAHAPWCERCAAGATFDHARPACPRALSAWEAMAHVEAMLAAD